MSDSTPASPDGSNGEGYSPSADCDPGLLDYLKCEAEGIKAQADYNALHSTELATARTNYDKARVDYRKARETAAPTYKKLREQVHKVLEQLRCLINHSATVALLDEAYATVKEELRNCPGDAGCALDDDGDFDALMNCDDDDVPGAIKKIEARIAAAKKVFDDLITEPTELPKRVAERQKEVDAIVEDMAKDPRTVDFKQLYARALVTRARLRALWRGFRDANAYVDCLCRALVCQVKGHDAVSHLKNREQVLLCQQNARDAKCAWLRAQTAVAVLEEYERLKAHKGSGYDDGNGGYDGGGNGGYDDGGNGGGYDDGDDGSGDGDGDDGDGSGGGYEDGDSGSGGGYDDGGSSGGDYEDGGGQGGGGQGGGGQGGGGQGGGYDPGSGGEGYPSGGASGGGQGGQGRGSGYTRPNRPSGPRRSDPHR